MFNDFYPSIERKDSLPVQSLLFGHRIQDSQTLHEYLIEFLIIATAHKKILNGDDIVHTDMFPISKELENHSLQIMPQAYIGLKRFVFFDNSRIDTKSKADKEAYERCLEILKSHIEGDNKDLNENDILSVLQNVLYGFSVQNAGRSWFTKNLLPVCPEVLFPESLGTQKHRNNVTLKDVEKLDSSFSFNSYTYMARGGEVYYLHLLHAINEHSDKKAVIENHIEKMLGSLPEMSRLSRFVQDNWVKDMKIPVSDDEDPVVKKTLSVIPSGFSGRDNNTVCELENFLTCRLQPMEKLNIFSYGMILQMLRMMHTIASDNITGGTSAWVMDMSTDAQRERSEIKKLAVNCYDKNEESIIKYLNKGIEHYFHDSSDIDKAKKFKEAENDSYKLFRKLAKNIGIVIPLTGSGMRFTLSEEIIKFLVMSLIPAGQKVTYEYLLELMYNHFRIVIAVDEYNKAVVDGFLTQNSNIMFLSANKSAFLQKLKDCGFLRDLSDATAIVENPYEREED